MLFQSLLLALLFVVVHCSNSETFFNKEISESSKSKTETITPARCSPPRFFYTASNLHEAWNSEENPVYVALSMDDYYHFHTDIENLIWNRRARPVLILSKSEVEELQGNFGDTFSLMKSDFYAINRIALQDVIFPFGEMEPSLKERLEAHDIHVWDREVLKQVDELVNNPAQEDEPQSNREIFYTASNLSEAWNSKKGPAYVALSMVDYNRFRTDIEKLKKARRLRLTLILSKSEVEGLERNFSGRFSEKRRKFDEIKIIKRDFYEINGIDLHGVIFPIGEMEPSLKQRLKACGIHVWDREVLKQVDEPVSDLVQIDEPKSKYEAQSQSEIESKPQSESGDLQGIENSPSLLSPSQQSISATTASVSGKRVGKYSLYPDCFPSDFSSDESESKDTFSADSVSPDSSSSSSESEIDQECLASKTSQDCLPPVKSETDQECLLSETAQEFLLSETESQCVMPMDKANDTVEVQAALDEEWCMVCSDEANN